MSHSRLFPESYSLWLSKRLPGTLIERHATCDACAMVKPTGLTRDPGPFDPDLKCCTYFPFIPNFGIGDMLNSYGESAQLRLAAAAQKGLLLPLGLFASPERERLQSKAGSKSFGKRRDMLCPFFDSTRSGCSIWRSRPGVCATYFCRSERDEEGFELWSDIESYLNHFEWTLANEVLARMNFSHDTIEICEAVMMEDEPGPERDWLVRSAWGEWRGRETTYFTECTKLAGSISQGELNELLGDESLALEASIRDRVP